ncbi:cysteine protease StiP domain-containing protein [Salipiger marinus]|uniref:PELOTA RNA binding domain-containing protein n=1 Tax=Salipiger marinus TaxID=555512 RepID=A0A1G8UJG6_9RHOB|nr:cysteine protease StiP domain-containing protein [Salipiger marinus]SDJ53928.1 PELOTA RNA binding domain-containing protein [Salipiger marinus]
MLDKTQDFSGSYLPEDVTFLLKPVHLATTDVSEKERRIQSGEAHYSEMLSEERRPDPTYLEIFEDAFARNTARMGYDLACIAATIAADVASGRLPEQVTLCSLVRAGVPYGVLLKRELTALGVDCTHFGVSIIRDRGLDAVAMAHVLAAHDPGGVLFVDGWTGKGAISTELTRSWTALGMPGAPQLVVLADPAGFAALSGSHEDWLIPSGILGANVSGLISRTILNDEVVGSGDFHGTVPADHLADMDLSRRFVDTVSEAVAKARPLATPRPRDPALLAHLRSASAACVRSIAGAHAVENLNRIKPGIAEATRAVLRRRPKAVFVRDAFDPDVAALVHLCRTDGIRLVESLEHTGPYRAITLIEKVT